MKWITERPDYACIFLTRYEFNKRHEYRLWRFDWTPGEPPENTQDDENTCYYYLGWFTNDGDEWDDIVNCDHGEYLVIEILPTLSAVHERKLK